MSTRKAFGKVSAKLREDRAMTQVEMGEAIGSTAQTVSNVEAGSVRWNAEHVERWAPVFGLTAAEMLRLIADRLDHEDPSPGKRWRLTVKGKAIVGKDARLKLRGTCGSAVSALTPGEGICAHVWGGIAGAMNLRVHLAQTGPDGFHVYADKRALFGAAPGEPVILCEARREINGERCPVLTIGEGGPVFAWYGRAK